MSWLLKQFQKILVSLFFTFCVLSAFAAEVKNVQNGTFTLLGTRQIVPITPVIDNKSMLVFSLSADNGAAGSQDTHLRGQLNCSAGQCKGISFKRYGSNGRVTVRWQVVEFNQTSKVKIQRGIETQVSMSDATPAQKTIAVDVDRRKSVVLLSEFVQGGAVNDADFTRGHINNLGDLVLTVGEKKRSISKAEIAWQVVEYQDAEVQAGGISFSRTDVSKTVAISKIDLNKSLLVYNYYSMGNTAAASLDTYEYRVNGKKEPPICQNLVSGAISGSTVLQFNRGCLYGEGEVHLAWFVIEFSDATRVQHDVLTFDRQQTEQTVSLDNAVDRQCAMTIAGYHQRGGLSSATTDHTASAWFHSALDTQGKELTLLRGQTNNAPAEVGWFVVEFAGCTATVPATDYGDAPLSGMAPDGHHHHYGVASHRLVKGYYLGFADPSTGLERQAAVGAESDVNDDMLAMPKLMQGKEATFTLFVSGQGGYLQSWIDFNGNGMFDADEQVARNLQDNGKGDDALANDGAIVFKIVVPLKATSQQTYMRFRWSTSPNLDSTTLASNGEVEDYAVTIQRTE